MLTLKTDKVSIRESIKNTIDNKINNGFEIDNDPINSHLFPSNGGRYLQGATARKHIHYNDTTSDDGKCEKKTKREYML